jgi:Asp-tRNA(Asn)/Glu-tRNA(Gln) amidotransferase A subunit family amidase
MLTRLPTIADAQERIRAGTLAPHEVVEYCVARARKDHSKSWVRVADDAELATATGGLLCGVAVAVKDLYDVAGCPTEAGSPLRKG